MSGIVGIVNADGAPVDPALLRAMTDFLAFRGPDAQTMWTDGAVGFGHALLRTTDESNDERQPCSLDGTVWITADARIDARQELARKLRERGRDASEARPDVELILHAYHVWGEECVQHLLGDFAFAIWDGQLRRLFCARDHFGIKPFFYAAVGGCLVFGNTLDCVRLHPAVSGRLNERWIGDFLLFGQNYDSAISVFADVQRLPAAHVLTCSAEGVRLKRYWKLPTDGDIRYRREAEYVERFKDLLKHAVADRLRTKRVAMFMSGGLDSSSVAATAVKVVRPANGLDLRAFTIVFDELIPDDERHYTGIVARHLNVPVTFFAADGYRLFERQDQKELHSPEPRHEPLSAAYRADFYPQIAAHARVVLTGEGGDPSLVGSSVYSLNLLKNGHLGRLAVDVWRSLSRGWLPQVGFRSRLRRWLGKTPVPVYPTWLNKDFEAEAKLRARWAEVNAPPREHPRRPEAYESLTSPHWEVIFKGYDPGETRCPFEVRHSLFDLRLLNYVLAIPALPWTNNKELLRCALTSLVPESIRLRPKTPVRQSPVGARLRRENCVPADGFESCAALTRFVELEQVPRLIGESDPEKGMVNTRPYSLDTWLRLTIPSEKQRQRGDGPVAPCPMVN